MTQTYSATETYSVADIQVVMRRVTADILMIASSTGAVTEDRARDFGHDIEVLAKNGYLQSVDVTLVSNGVEQKATRFEVTTTAGDLSMSRPGGVLWPRVPNPELRIVLYYTDACTPTARQQIGSKLRLGWGPTNVDTSHASLTSSAGREYVSNGYGMQRKDFS
jgi:Bacterial HORMA domain family 1